MRLFALSASLLGSSTDSSSTAAHARAEAD
jgi:hypothetical protein